MTGYTPRSGDRVVVGWHDDMDGPLSGYWIIDTATVERVDNDEVVVRIDHAELVEEDDSVEPYRAFQFGMPGWFIDPISTGYPRRIKLSGVPAVRAFIGNEENL
jgi:hypothetical protein